MSLRLEMLQVARLAPNVLDESQDLAAQFFLSQQTSEGGFQDRDGKPDLYYTVFGLEGLCALRRTVPKEPIEAYLQTFQNGEQLDFVHLSSLVRCWANLHGNASLHVDSQAILQHMDSYRTTDGGFNPTPDVKSGSAYGCFLALGIYQDLDMDVPDRERLVSCVESLRSNDGGYGNLPRMEFGLTTAAAAAICLLHALEAPVPEGVDEWMLGRFHPQGGFFASLMTPLPDLLSTATALHALERLKVDLEPIREPTLDFIDSLWCNQGGFCGNWTDDILDCEYSYYGLLSLGHLSL